jgi:quinol monooxygenase YgiN
VADAITVVARIRAAKGKADALERLLTEQAAVIRRSEPGCLAYRLHRSTRDPEVFLFYETYTDDAAFEVHRKSPHLAAFRQRREQEGLTEGAVEVEIFRAVMD